MRGPAPPSRPTRGRRLVVCLAALFFLRLTDSGAGPTGVGQGSREYEVKAVFVLNFLHFVDWPENTFVDPASPIVVGVFGENPFGPLLRLALADERVNQHPVQVRELAAGDTLKGCHVVFISRSERSRLRVLLAGLREMPVLTISEIDRFCQSGGMINFTMQDETVRFEINPHAARRAGLHVSAKLLALAKAVDEEP